jgi:predicted naringenin-chalcone synthase
MSFAILGVGTALPPTTITQTEAMEVARIVCARTDKQAALLPLFYRLTGIEKRHVIFQSALVRDVLEGTAATDSIFLPARAGDDRGPTTAERMRYFAQEAGKLALPACRKCLDRANLPPGQMTHLITVSCTGFTAPGVDFELIQGLGLSPNIERTHVGFMGCHGAFNGLRVARGFAGSEAGARVLLCAVELCSLHYHYGWDADKMVGNALFADGAAAVVGMDSTAAPEGVWRVAGSGSCLFPDSADDMTWIIGEHGFEMRLSARVPELIGQQLRPWLEKWLDGRGLKLRQIGSWAIHPGGPRILTAIERALGLSSDATAVSRDLLRSCGNLSSATVLFLLDRLRSAQAARPCVALGFGPGLVAEAMLLE